MIKSHVRLSVAFLVSVEIPDGVTTINQTAKTNN
jgi:hypothetical protein